MKDEYKKHIVSTKDHQVWLHRTHTSNIEGILKNGLNFRAGDLSSTATLQPKEIEKAEKYYEMTHKGSNAVVVIKIPQEIAKRHYLQTEDAKGLRHAGYELDKDVTYLNNGFNIQRQHIHGWINKDTNEYYENPYRNKPQKFTNAHFPPQIYGGLEKDLIPEGKSTKKNKNIKQKRELLPPPPSSIDISI